MDAKLTLGEKIRLLRTRADLSQVEFAEKIGVHFSTVSRWERDETTEEMPLSSLRRVAAVLGVEIKDLLNDAA